MTWQHGTITGYINHGCRCEPCRQTRRDYYGNRPMSVYNAERAAQHGTESKYTAGCRCGPCLTAANEARAERRRTGTVKTHNRSGYCNGCRCDICREANNEYARRQRRKRVRA